jgi:RNA polymerase sigma-70 factor (sigma-E family)
VEATEPMAFEEQRAFEDFVRGRSTALLRTSYLLTGDRGAAEDLLQGVLERVARRWASIADSPEAYVRRALTNAAVNRWRRRRPAGVQLLDSDHPATEDVSDRVAVRDQLIRGLMALPARQRAVLVLRYFDDLTEAETADALGCAIGTVKSQASRGLERLRVLVDAQDPHPVDARSPR